MQVKKRNIILSAAMLILIIFLLYLLIPRKYAIAEYKYRPNTKYWNLKSGIKIGYYFFESNRNKKEGVLIYLHGGPGGAVYDRNIDLLKPLTDNGYDVYLYDQAGCGASDRYYDISEYSVEGHRNDLEEIVHLIGLQKVTLMGQSWGAMLATEFVAYNPQKVEKLILTSPGPILPVNNSLSEITVPDSLDLIKPAFTNRQGREKVYSLRVKILEMLAKAFNWKLAGDKEMDGFADLLNHEMGKSTYCNPPTQMEFKNGSGYYAMVKTVQSFDFTTDIRAKISNLSTPVLIMRGQCDGIPWGFTSEYLQLFPNHQLKIIPGAGHSIGYEQPELYIKTILEFLNQ